ncbi:Rieske (2Fe-2S) protein [Natrialba asiatica]|uniref:Rieske (2Fe-2S) domain-containing protein n=1 Tax=Natrialba asiatica (strain ATCC 700177 / DSM 12278 / JCM 9576 / FERM P-10747 / NBRC 102637 / 172P1) TaxID=29540 RepID=M0AWQ5_NATA1|nr:Rieske (2Fe-2S) protein [Natrialba asiatica]ELZ03101.1 Rieske (2Fe-2S) domain-containing protein [Natrialba asiatica DSM 12278]
MGVRMRLTTVDTVYEERSWLFTVRDQRGEKEEVILVPCTDAVAGSHDDGGSDGDGSAAAGRGDVGSAGETTSSEGGGGTAADADIGTAVEAWVNQCTHEFQRLDRGMGAAMRDGQIICPKHGSMFDACSGYCDNGEAADTTLPSVDVAVDDGEVYLTDDEMTFLHQGGIDEGDDGDGGPSSTSHLSL